MSNQKDLCPHIDNDTVCMTYQSRSEFSPFFKGPLPGADVVLRCLDKWEGTALDYCPYGTLPRTTLKLLLTFNVVLLLVGLPGTLTVLTAFHSTRSLWKANQLFIYSLSLADLFLLLIKSGHQTYLLTNSSAKKDMDVAVCIFLGYAGESLTVVCHLHTVVIALDRYVHICCQASTYHRFFSGHKVGLFSFGIWILGFSGLAGLRSGYVTILPACSLLVLHEADRLQLRQRMQVWLFVYLFSFAFMAFVYVELALRVTRFQRQRTPSVLRSRMSSMLSTAAAVTVDIPAEGNKKWRMVQAHFLPGKAAEKGSGGSASSVDTTSPGYSLVSAVSPGDLPTITVSTAGDLEKDGRNAKVEMEEDSSSSSDESSSSSSDSISEVEEEEENKKGSGRTSSENFVQKRPGYSSSTLLITENEIPSDEDLQNEPSNSTIAHQKASRTAPLYRIIRSKTAAALKQYTSVESEDSNFESSRISSPPSPPSPVSPEKSDSIKEEVQPLEPPDQLPEEPDQNFNKCLPSTSVSSFQVMSTTIASAAKNKSCHARGCDTPECFARKTLLLAEDRRVLQENVSDRLINLNKPLTLTADSAQLQSPYIPRHAVQRPNVPCGHVCIAVPATLPVDSTSIFDRDHSHEIRCLKNRFNYSKQLLVNPGIHFPVTKSEDALGMGWDEVTDRGKISGFQAATILHQDNSYVTIASHVGALQVLPSGQRQSETADKTLQSCCAFGSLSGPPRLSARIEKQRSEPQDPSGVLFGESPKTCTACGQWHLNRSENMLHSTLNFAQGRLAELNQKCCLLSRRCYKRHRRKRILNGLLLTGRDLLGRTVGHAAIADSNRSNNADDSSSVRTIDSSDAGPPAAVSTAAPAGFGPQPGSSYGQQIRTSQPVVAGKVYSHSFSEPSLRTIQPNPPRGSRSYNYFSSGTSGSTAPQPVASRLSRDRTGFIPTILPDTPVDESATSLETFSKAIPTSAPIPHSPPASPPGDGTTSMVGPRPGTPGSGGTEIDSLRPETPGLGDTNTLGLRPGSLLTAAGDERAGQCGSLEGDGSLTSVKSRKSSMWNFVYDWVSTQNRQSVISEKSEECSCCSALCRGDQGRISRLMLGFSAFILLDLLYCLYFLCFLVCSQSFSREPVEARQTAAAKKCWCLSWTYHLPMLISSLNAFFYGFLNRHICAAIKKLYKKLCAPK